MEYDKLIKIYIDKEQLNKLAYDGVVFECKPSIFRLLDDVVIIGR